MDWRVKAIAQNVFSHLPKGRQFNYMFQEHVTRSNHLDEARFLDILRWGTSHLEAIRRHESRPLQQLTFYEFGAGYHLVGPLTFRLPDPKGDRVKLTMHGKFLPYRKY